MTNIVAALSGEKIDKMQYLSDDHVVTSWADLRSLLKMDAVVFFHANTFSSDFTPDSSFTDYNTGDVYGVWNGTKDGSYGTLSLTSPRYRSRQWVIQVWDSVAQRARDGRWKKTDSWVDVMNFAHSDVLVVFHFTHNNLNITMTIPIPVNEITSEERWWFATIHNANDVYSAQTRVSTSGTYDSAVFTAGTQMLVGAADYYLYR